VHEGRGEIEAPLHPARVGPDAVPERVADVDEAAQIDQALVDLPALEPVEPGLKPEQLEAGLAVVEGGVLEGHADP